MGLSLAYRRDPQPVRKVVRKTVVYQTVRQTVLHLHQAAPGRYAPLPRAYGLRLLPAAAPPQNREADDASRPAQTARRLLRTFELTRRELRPFFGGIVRTVLREERERYRSRPAQAASFLWTLLRRREAVWTLTRFCRNTVEPLEGPERRAAVRRRPAAEEPEVLPAVPPAKRQTAEERPAPPPRPEPPVREAPLMLSEAQFRALARDVAGLLGREARLEKLRRGGFEP